MDFLKVAVMVLWGGQVMAQSSTALTSYVNPFIGTGAVNGSLSGNNFPGATVPFGMVQLSPDTRDMPDWAEASGYNYNDNTIAGFSHTHLSGTGVAELFDLLVMPMTGPFKTRAGERDHTESGYRSSFSHQQESARPGYYQVKLLDYNINAELTATTHAGFHRYTFPATEEAHVILDLNHSMNKGSWSSRIINAQFRLVDQYTIEGYRLITGWAKLRKVYFSATFSQPVTHIRLVDGGKVYDNAHIVNGSDLRAILDFDRSKGGPLLVKIGLSAVSTANARLNVDTEIPGWDFDAVATRAADRWEKELSKINIEGSALQKELFYTALYHACIQPNTLSDVNGDFMAADYTTRQLSQNETAHYSTFSLWDTYRGAHPLYTFIEPKRSADFVNSMISQYDTYGYLPIWQLWGQENYCMIGNHSIPVIVDAVMKGLPGIDVDKAYEAVKNSSLRAHPNAPFEVWEQYGYMPENIQSQSVSITLEMAYDDWCVAQLAKHLGKTADYERFSKRAAFYRNLYNSSTHFFQPKDDQGQWMEPFDPYKYGANGGNPFTEGNAWQYYWYVPQNVPDLIRLTGGDNAFVEKLDSFFTLDQRGELNSNASGFIGQYAHGNEPSHHVAYLYNYAGAPWKTQYYVSRVMNELYNNTSAGYAGNDDCGEMSVWYVFGALGMYPVNPANGIYVIGSPAVDKATLTLSSGKQFTITVSRKSASDIYIQSVQLNGKTYPFSYIRYADIVKGGTIGFTMGATPNRKWAVKPEYRPPLNGF